MIKETSLIFYASLNGVLLQNFNLQTSKFWEINIKYAHANGVLLSLKKRKFFRSEIKYGHDMNGVILVILLLLLD